MAAARALPTQQPRGAGAPVSGVGCRRAGHPLNMAQQDRARALLQSTHYHRIFVDREPVAFAAEFGVEAACVVDVHAERFRAAVAAQPATVTLERPPVFDDPVLILSTSGTRAVPRGRCSPQRPADRIIGAARGLCARSRRPLSAGQPALSHQLDCLLARAPRRRGAHRRAAVRLPLGRGGTGPDYDKLNGATPPDARTRSGQPRRSAQRGLFEQLHEGGTLKWIAVGSGPLAPEVQERLLDRGVLVLFRWGMSENYLGSTNMRPATRSTTTGRASAPPVRRIAILSCACWMRRGGPGVAGGPAGAAGQHPRGL